MRLTNQELVKKLAAHLKKKFLLVNSPIIPDYFGYSEPTVTYDYSTDSANKLLDKSGYRI